MTQETSPFPASVIKVLDEYTVVINRGSVHGVKKTHRFLIYALGEELMDPETQESLGVLEIVRGVGEVVHVQEKISTVRSIEHSTPGRRIIRRKPNMYSIFSGRETEETETIESGQETLPFAESVVGDRAKPV